MYTPIAVGILMILGTICIIVVIGAFYAFRAGFTQSMISYQAAAMQAAKNRQEQES